MRGEILSYDDVTGTGLISGDDGVRYGFERSAIHPPGVARMGARVDFVPEDTRATQIMVLAGMSQDAQPVTEGIDWKTLFLSFNGRTRRQHFWIAWLILLGVSVVLGWIPVIGTIISIALIWPNLAISVKRLHDMGKTGWFVVIPWIATIIGFIMIIGAVGTAIFTNPESFENQDPSVAMAMFGSMMGGLSVMLLVGLAFLLWIGITPSQPGDNKFGPNPKGE